MMRAPLLAALVLLLATCPAAAQAPEFGAAGLDLTARDLAVRPGDDFYRYAQGAAFDRLALPAGVGRLGRFDTLAARVETRIRTMLEAAAARPDDPWPAGAFYAAFMDDARVEALGASPMAAELDTLRAVATREQLARAQGGANREFGRRFFSLSVDADLRHPDRRAVYVQRSGLAMQDPSLYLGGRSAARRATYRQYVTEMLTLIGWDKPAANAKAIVKLETAIADASVPGVDRYDVDKAFRTMDLAKLEALAPGYPWRDFLQGATLGRVDTVVVFDPATTAKVAALYASTPLEVLKAWQAFTLADEAAPYLSKAFVDPHFEFHDGMLRGMAQPYPRWRRAVRATNLLLGDCVGERYVAAYLAPGTKGQVEAIVRDVTAAMARRIPQLDWMTPATKARALEKLGKLTVQVGYPDRWPDCSQVSIRRDDLYGDVERAAAFNWARQVASLDRPDTAAWGLTPQTLNAYYDPTANVVVIPAAMLQAPFFDPYADPAVNYGAIGAMIGHQILYAFDQQGGDFSAEGAYDSWWTPADRAAFAARSARLEAQYAAVEPLPGSFIDARLTAPANIADLGGILLALDAYKASLNGRPAPVVDGLSGEQRLLMAWAQVWLTRHSDNAMRHLLASDQHAPAMARVNMPMRNIDAWYEAFDVKPGDKLYLKPEERARIW